MSGDQKTIAVLVGGPFDGVTLEPAPAGEVEEIILRTTSYFPSKPRDAVYRFDAVACLNLPRLIRGFIAGTRMLIYNHTGESALMKRIRALDVSTAQRSNEVNKLVADVQRLQVAVQKKDEKCRKCRERQKRKGRRP